MKAMLLDRPRSALRWTEVEKPAPAAGQVLLRVTACGVCRTDLHVVDGELSHPILPLIPGHEIVGVVEALGEGVTGIAAGERMGVPWLGSTCGRCSYCMDHQENLCDEARFTGYQINGGYAEYTVADARYCFSLPDKYDDVHAAPLLCAGLIGYRSLVMAGSARKFGFYGFGAAAHILTQAATFQGREVFAFTKPGDHAGREFARSLGAVWAGGTDETPPAELDAAILFAPAGELVPLALRAVRKGGVVVCAGIHMSDIPSFPYEILWGERVVRSVANLTRRDGIEFFDLVGKAAIRTETEAFPLERANEALNDLRSGKVRGAAVLTVS